MAKLDVGVGDEFPTEEIKRDPDGTIHHHHYYYRRPRRPFGFLRFVLGVILIGLIFHLLHLASWDAGICRSCRKATCDLPPRWSALRG